MNELLIASGVVIVIVGAFFEFVGALGVLRLSSFFLRLHAATVGCIGGSVLPLLGTAIIALGLEDMGAQRLYVAGTCVASAIIILILAPSGSHSLARAAYVASAVPKQPLEYDSLREKLRGE